ncbi:hypothetical protein BGW80DRAFT_1289291 [Lactifluus volemus]|nr:hypothetical protein BGW80DRAFT_1289291 [Lactifluus volemus]
MTHLRPLLPVALQGRLCCAASYSLSLPGVLPELCCVYYIIISLCRFYPCLLRASRHVQAFNTPFRAYHNF